MADIINELLGLDDAALLKKVGFADKLAKFKEDLATANGLTGKSREKVADAIEKAFQPSSYIIEDLGWQVERAQEKTKAAKASKFVEDCGCVGD